jgi:hypothetical protein
MRHELFHTLRFRGETDSLLRGRCWYAYAGEDLVRFLLRNGLRDTQDSPPFVLAGRGWQQTLDDTEARQLSLSHGSCE